MRRGARPGPRVVVRGGWRPPWHCRTPASSDPTEHVRMLGWVGGWRGGRSGVTDHADLAVGAGFTDRRTGAADRRGGPPVRACGSWSVPPGRIPGWPACRRVRGHATGAPFDPGLPTGDRAAAGGLDAQGAAAGGRGEGGGGVERGEQGWPVDGEADVRLAAYVFAQLLQVGEWLAAGAGVHPYRAGLPPQALVVDVDAQLAVRVAGGQQLGGPLHGGGWHPCVDRVAGRLAPAAA